MPATAEQSYSVLHCTFCFAVLIKRALLYTPTDYTYIFTVFVKRPHDEYIFWIIETESLKKYENEYEMVAGENSGSQRWSRVAR